MKKMTDKSPIIINNELLFEQYDYFNITKTYNKITGEMKKFNDELYRAYVNQIPVIMVDDITTWIACQLDINDVNEKLMYVYFYAIGTHYISEIHISIDVDKINVVYTVEDLLTSDNVKTLFGNQSIVGSGNIDLYRHNLRITHTSNTMSKLYMQLTSSNKLKCDSVQDLTTVLKPTTGARYAIDSKYYIDYYNGVWRINSEDGEGLANITALEDYVETI